ncbi:WG repeat-containing protein [Pontimicrobium sp. MEBiC06410]
MDTTEVKPEEKKVEKEIIIDYTNIDCDSIKNTFVFEGLEIGYKFENKLLKYYECLNSKSENKYDDKIKQLKDYAGVSNEGDVILARENLSPYEYVLLDKKLNEITRSKYISHNHNNILFKKIDTIETFEAYLYYEDTNKAEYLKIRSNNYLKLIDIQNKPLNKMRFHAISFYDKEEFMEVKWVLNYGIVDFNGKVLIPTNYRDLSYDYNRKVFKARYKRRWGVIDLNNEILVPFKYKSEELVEAELMRL